jgi:hypothetical protein
VKVSQFDSGDETPGAAVTFTDTIRVLRQLRTNVKSNLEGIARHPFTVRELTWYFQTKAKKKRI